MKLIGKDLRKLYRQKTTVFGLVLFIALCLLALVGPLVNPNSPTEITINFLQGPSPTHWFGTDDLGRDLFIRTVFGIRTSLLVGIGTALGSGLIGLFFGLIAGYSPKADNLIMRVMDIIMAFPPMLIALAMLAIFGRRSTNILIVLSIVYTPRIARVVRSSTLSAREETYVEAARAIGARAWSILLRHILPNIFSPFIIQLTFVFAYGILSEAGLGFIGVGIQPPTPSLGNILSDGRAYLVSAPWMTAFPGIVLFFLVMSINLVGDGLREFIDPKVNQY
jgi:peptide/nickel transport system permease protein